MATSHMLVLNGPNLQKLGKRDIDIYGNRTLEDLKEELRSAFSDVQFDFFQSDIEGELIKRLNSSSADVAGVVFNAGAYTHTSVALRDAIAALDCPVIEVHISNVLAREPFRHVSLIGGVCAGSILGFGFDSYHLAVSQLIKMNA